MAQLHIAISKKIKEANISLALDVNQTDYRNGDTVTSGTQTHTK